MALGIFPRLPRRICLWGALILLALTGCGALERRAAQEIKPAGYSLDASRKLLAVSFYALTELYVEPVSLDKLAAVGLRRLLAADPSLALNQQDEFVQLTQAQRTIALFPKPEPVDAAAWARMTATLIDTARRHSAILDALTADRIYFEFLNGVTSQLDGISRYDEPERARDNRAHREGFGGIGVRIALQDPRLIHAVQPDTPAARAGILAGDILLAIDGRSTQGMSSRQIVDALRGPRGSEVLLTLERIGNTTPLTRSIVRQLIVDQTITWRRDAGDIGYIHISDFTLHTNDQLKKALNAVMKQGRPLRGMVVDLRDNPGGFLSQGTDAADLFLESGLLLTSQGRNLEANQRFNATPGDLLHGLPLVVLVNGHSASAAEIMTAALQDNGRAVVIGSSTYGKGTVQKITPLENGAELILTFARFHAPSGYRLQNRGVLPNLCTSTVGGSAEELIEMLRQGQTNPALLLARHRAAESKPLAPQNTAKAICPSFTGKRMIDLELDAAHRLLANPALFQRALRGTAMNGARRD